MLTLKNGADVAETIHAFNLGRKPKLVQLKYERMAKDPFAFFRGTDHLFADHWPRLQPTDIGPSIWICGDLHLENFGAYRADDHTYLYDINDFDEALVAPCGLDVVRCTTSILLAAQLWRFSPVQAMRTVLGFLDRYRLAVSRAIRHGHTGEMALGSSRGPIWRLLESPMRGDQDRFLDELTERQADGRLRLERRTGRFRKVGSDVAEKVGHAVAALVSAGHHGTRTYEVLDVARRIAGIGSLGLERYGVLLTAGPGHERVFDVKAIPRPSLLPCTVEPQPDGGEPDATRAVRAQRQLLARSPRGLALVDVDGRWLRLREMVPEENRTGLSRLRDHPRRLRRAVGIAGRLTGWAHVRGSVIAGEDRKAALRAWAEGPALDAVIASAVRYAEQTRLDHRAFRKARLASHA